MRMLFFHFAKTNSVRDTSNGLRSITGNANHLGIKKMLPSHSSISYINEHRNWQMFRELYLLMKEFFQIDGLYVQRKKFKEISRKIYMLDYDGCLPT